MLEQVYHESNMEDAKAPLLLNASEGPKITNDRSLEADEPDRLTEALNKYGKAMEFEFSTS